jgi:hypothetical protein
VLRLSTALTVSSRVSAAAIVSDEAAATGQERLVSLENAATSLREMLRSADKAANKASYSLVARQLETVMKTIDGERVKLGTYYYRSHDLKGIAAVFGGIFRQMRTKEEHAKSLNRQIEHVENGFRKKQRK